MTRQIFFFIPLLLCLWGTSASAFWGSDSGASSSGLDVTSGFDINTIKVLKGTVTVPPERRWQEQHSVMTIETGREIVTVMLGPWEYWEKQTVKITKGLELSLTGSLAQGKDGSLYMFTQYFEVISSGETVRLRSENGKPLWSHPGTGAQNSTRQHNGSTQRPGSGIRGSGFRGGRR